MIDEEKQAHSWVPSWTTVSFTFDMAVSWHKHDTNDNYVSNGFKGRGCDIIKIVEQYTSQSKSIKNVTDHESCKAVRKTERSVEAKQCIKLLEWQYCGKYIWDGIWEDLRPPLLTVTEHDNKPPSFHKSRCASLSWRTCHDNLNKKGVFKALGIRHISFHDRFLLELLTLTITFDMFKFLIDITC